MRLDRIIANAQAAIHRFLRKLAVENEREELVLLRGKNAEEFRRRIESADADVLAALVAKAPEWLRIEIAGNSIAVRSVGTLLAGDPSESVRTKLAKQPDLDPESASVLAEDESSFVRGELARNLIRIEPVAAKLARSDDFVKFSLAERKTSEIGRKAVNILLRSKNGGILIKLAESVESDRETLAKLAANSNDKVRETVAYNPLIGNETLELLASDPIRTIRSAVASRASNRKLPEAVVRKIETDPSPAVRNTFIVLSMAISTESAATFAKDRDAPVRQAIAARSDAISVADVMRLIGDRSAKVAETALETWLKIEETATGHERAETISSLLDENPKKGKLVLERLRAARAAA
jgi:hypothetical protein